MVSSAYGVSCRVAGDPCAGAAGKANTGRMCMEHHMLLLSPCSQLVVASQTPAPHSKQGVACFGLLKHALERSTQSVQGSFEKAFKHQAAG